MSENAPDRKRPGARLSAQDAAFLYGESSSGPLHIGTLSIFDSEIKFPELVEHTKRRLHLLPRYRQRLVFVPFNIAHAALEDDPDFKLENHLKPHRLPADAGEVQLLEAVMRAHAPMLDRDRPLWEMHLFSGMADGRSAILWKIHHCLVDGVSGMELLATLLDLRPDATYPDPPPKPWRPKPLPSAGEVLARALSEAVQTQYESARKVAGLFSGVSALARRAKPLANSAEALGGLFSRPVAAAPWNLGFVTRARSLAWFRCSFADVRAIRNVFGGTVNDVVVAVLSEAAARYLKHHGCDSEGKIIRIGCPVNVRRDTEQGALGNRVSMMFPETPAAVLGALRRLRAVTHETMKVKSARQPQTIEAIVSMAELLPATLVGMSLRAAAAATEAAAAIAESKPIGAFFPRVPPQVNFIATNVPSSQVPQYLAGHKCADFIGLIPLAGSLGYGVGIVSYNQSLFFGLMAAPNLMPDVELMKSYVAEVFEELDRAAAAGRADEARVARHSSESRPG